MDLPNLARDLDKLATADAIVADSYIRYIFRKGALYLFACLLAVLSLSLLGVALYWLLESSLGPVGAMASLGVVGLLIAGMIAVVGIVQRPGRDHDVALKMRRSSIATLEQNVGSQISPSAMLYPAGEALISSVILPLLGVLVSSLKSSRAAKADEMPAEPSGIKNAPAELGPKS